MATGHCYSRRGTGADGRALLRKGQPANDQSYMLSRLPQDILRRVVFPLGGRRSGRSAPWPGEAALPWRRPGSMEICFIPDGDYAAWLDRRGNTPPGNFVDREGRVLASTRGHPPLYPGPAAGPGVSGPHRYFVSAIRPETNEVVLSDGTDLHADRTRCTDLNWIAIEGLEGSGHAPCACATPRWETPAIPLSRHGDAVEIRMLTPGPGPTPGQLAVFYDRDIVLAADGSADPWNPQSLPAGQGGRF